MASQQAPINLKFISKHHSIWPFYIIQFHHLCHHLYLPKWILQWCSPIKHSIFMQMNICNLKFICQWSMIALRYTQIFYSNSIRENILWDVKWFAHLYFVDSLNHDYATASTFKWHFQSNWSNILATSNQIHHEKS